MRSQVGKSLRNAFKEQLNLRLPGFRAVADAIVPPGWKVYGMDASSDWSFYLVLATFPLTDSFVLEAAFSRNGHFPQVLGLMLPKPFPEFNMTKDSTIDGGFRFRISRLWQFQEHVWHLVQMKTWDEKVEEQEEFLRTGIIPPEPSLEEALGNIDASVNDAIEKVEQHVLPYFDEVAMLEGFTGSISNLAKSGRP